MGLGTSIWTKRIELKVHKEAHTFMVNDFLKKIFETAQVDFKLGM